MNTPDALDNGSELNGVVFTTRFAGGKAGPTASKPSCAVRASSRRTPGRTIRRPAGSRTVPADPQTLALRPTRPARDHQRATDTPWRLCRSL